MCLCSMVLTSVSVSYCNICHMVQWCEKYIEIQMYFIAAPLSLQVELHVHLDGAIQIKTILDVAK